jgi:predicted metallo-beta-lactamase superfamily hydrolase
VFGSVVAGAFQIAFRAEMHANDFFYFLKIIFDISTSKQSKKYKPHLILTKENNSNLNETQLQTKYQTFPYSSNRQCTWILLFGTC